MTEKLMTASDWMKLHGEKKVKRKISYAHKLKSLQKTIDRLELEVKEGNKSAAIELAMGNALYDYLKEGNEITDLEWFRYTSYFTGNIHTPIAEVENKDE